MKILRDQSGSRWVEPVLLPRGGCALTATHNSDTSIRRWASTGSRLRTPWRQSRAGCRWDSRGRHPWNSEHRFQLATNATIELVPERQKVAVAMNVNKEKQAVRQVPVVCVFVLDLKVCRTGIGPDRPVRPAELLRQFFDTGDVWCEVAPLKFLADSFRSLGVWWH